MYIKNCLNENKTKLQEIIYTCLLNIRLDPSRRHGTKTMYTVDLPPLK